MAMVYTVKQVAEMLQMGTDIVTHFVDSGELDAIDVSARRGGRRRLRIPKDALRLFLERRRVHVPPLRKPRGQPSDLSN
jgi:excisionase family DNA binding protein